MRGRPSKYTKEIAGRICERLALGETLRSICRDEEFPEESTVRKWALENREDFYTQYAQARNTGLDAMAEEVMAIADVENADDVHRARLRVDTRKWYLSKLAPKRYGDRLNVDHGVQDSLAEVMKEINGRTRGLPSD